MKPVTRRTARLRTRKGEATMEQQYAWVLGAVILLAGLAPPARADEPAHLGKVAPEVLSKEQRKAASGMIDRDISRRTAEANAQNREGWSRVSTREQWEKYRDERIER